MGINQYRAITLNPVWQWDNLRPSVEPMSVKYADLVGMRDAGKLIPGQLYRITDYVTTTTQADTMSAGHAFDIIVMATAGNRLSENAWAALHKNDTYFAEARLEAWRLKYSIDNDVNRFAWADAESGKGVIYEMQDEWENRCGYDFKNILYKRCFNDDIDRYIAIPDIHVPISSSNGEEITRGEFNCIDDNFIYVYTFSCLASLNEDVDSYPQQADASMGKFVTDGELIFDPDNSYFDSPVPCNNIIEAYFISQSIDDGPLHRVMALPNIAFMQLFPDAYGANVYNNYIGGNSHDITANIKKFNYVHVTGEFRDSYIIGELTNVLISGYFFNNYINSLFNRVSLIGSIASCVFLRGVEKISVFSDLVSSDFADNVEDFTCNGPCSGIKVIRSLRIVEFSGDISTSTIMVKLETCTIKGILSGTVIKSADSDTYGFYNMYIYGYFDDKTISLPRNESGSKVEVSNLANGDVTVYTPAYK